MSEDYEVVTEALTGHARTLRGLVDELTVAADIASGVHLTAGAYGQIGQPFVTAMAALAEAGQNALRHGVDVLDAAGTAVGATVTTYDQHEAAGVTRLAAVGDELGRESTR